MLARCADKDKFYPLIETLFQMQRTWAVEKPIPPLLAIAKQAGFPSRASTPACRTRRRSMPVQEEQKRATDKLSRSTRRRPSSSTARWSKAACRSKNWPRSSTLLLKAP